MLNSESITECLVCVFPIGSIYKLAADNQEMYFLPSLSPGKESHK